LKKEIVKTSDGSNTLFVPELDETYHSTHGALQESLHVFVREGLQFRSELKEISILEVGFGTGLNALLSFIEADKTNKEIQYTSLEAFPLDWEVVGRLNYMDLVQLQAYAEPFKKMHTCDWESYMDISSSFSLRKLKVKLQEVRFENEFDLIYFDAFAPRVQPDLWTEEIFASMYKALKPSGVLVTYCAKGTVKRALKAVGFELQSIPGPPGKREMSRAVK
jgi:tRNA U34 5-methylaminomethyl-2-thiouridine-forming methyltransferase MnmC